MITIFKNIYETTQPYHIELDVELERIRTGQYKEQIEHIRSLKDKRARDKNKEQLPSVLFSGKFNGRTDDTLIEHSGLICLDFDGTTDKEGLINEYTLAAFLSPSGNGVKVLVKIPKDAPNHKGYFDGLAKLYDSKYFDKQCSNINRVCYESYDPDIYINKDSKEFEEKIIDSDYEFSEKIPHIEVTDDTEKFNRLLKWANNRYGFNDGNRNLYVFQLANACNSFGIDRNYAEMRLREFVSSGFDDKEIMLAVKSAYSYNDRFATRYFEDTENIDFARSELEKKSKEEIKDYMIKYKNVLPENADKIVKEAQGKGNIVDKFWQVNNKGKVSFDFTMFVKWLKQKQIYKYNINNKDGWILIQIHNNKIKEIYISDLINMVVDYIEALPYESDNIKRNDLMEYIIRASSVIFTPLKLKFLKDANIVWNKDNKKEAYFYFKDAAIKVDSENITKIQYPDLDGCIWESQIINREVEIGDWDKTPEFMQMLINVTNKEQDRFDSLLSITGYLLHSFKDEGLIPAIVLTDEIISDDPSGGTGKGIYINSIKQFKQCVSVDGKNFKFDNTFKWQRVNLDTQVIAFEDIERNFCFDKLFSVITEGIEVEKKGKDSFHIPFDQSPKIIITSNYVIPGDGPSHERRRIEMEFSQYYNQNKSPQDEFGHLLFKDWNKKEWNRFDNFMLQACRMYLANGICKPEEINLSFKKIKSSTCQQFIDYAEQNIKVDEEYIKKHLYNRFKEEHNDWSKLYSHTFTKWLNRWASYNEWTIEERASMGIRYIQFTKAK